MDEIQNDWNSNGNNMPSEKQAAIAEQFTRQMINRRKFQGIIVTNAFVLLTLFAIFAAWNMLTGKTNLKHEWGLLLLLLIPWAFACHFLRRHLQSNKNDKNAGTTILDSMRTALRVNRTTQTHLKLMGALYVVFVPILAFSMKQLWNAGKVSERELQSMALFFGLVLLLSAIGVALRYFTRLLPREKKIQELLTELNGEG
jgi:MFS family permease